MSSEKQPSSEAALEEASRRLYSERPEDFVAARGRLVRELRGQGQRELAGRVAALRRPTLGLWLANRLGDVAGPELQELLAVGGDLQDAQAKAARGDAGARSRFRELIARHSQLIEALVRAGQNYAAENGHGGGDEVSRRLAATLRAASTEAGESGRRLAQGSLPAEVEPGGFELVSAGSSEPGRGTGGRAGAQEDEAPAAGARKSEAVEETPGLEAAAQAAEARKAAAERERAAVAARSRADELARRARSLLREAARAQEEADTAEAEAASAEEEAAQARQAAGDAAARAKRR